MPCAVYGSMPVPWNALYRRGTSFCPDASFVSRSAATSTLSPADHPFLGCMRTSNTPSPKALAFAKADDAPDAASTRALVLCVPYSLRKVRILPCTCTTKLLVLHRRAPAIGEGKGEGRGGGHDHVAHKICRQHRSARTEHAAALGRRRAAGREAQLRPNQGA